MAAIEKIKPLVWLVRLMSGGVANPWLTGPMGFIQSLLEKFILDGRLRYTTLDTLRKA